MLCAQNHLHVSTASAFISCGRVRRRRWDEREVEPELGLVLPLLDEAADPLHRTRRAFTSFHSRRVEGRQCQAQNLPWSKHNIEVQSRSKFVPKRTATKPSRARRRHCMHHGSVRAVGCKTNTESLVGSNRFSGGKTSPGSIERSVGGEELLLTCTVVKGLRRKQMSFQVPAATPSGPSDRRPATP